MQGDMEKYRLTEDMAQDRKYWMTQIMVGPVQRDGQAIYNNARISVIAYQINKNSFVCGVYKKSSS